MKHAYLRCLLGMAMTLSSGLLAQQTTQTGTELTLATALARAAKGHPELAASQCRIEVAQGQRIGAALRPNPEAELEVEDLGGPDGVVASVYLGQTLELGGKRQGRIGVADREILRAASGLRLAQADLRAEVAQAHLAALTAQEEAALATEASGLAGEIARVVREQVDAGKVSPVMSSRAELAAARSRAAAANAGRLRDAAFTELAAHWDGKVDFAAIAGTLGDLGSLPTAARVMAAVATHPAVRVAEEDVESRRAALALARTSATPDVTVTAGMSHAEAEGETTFSLAASLPLPIFDRGQGEVAVAGAEVAEGMAELRATKRALGAQARTALVRLNAGFIQAKQLRDEILPAAQNTFAAVREGYAAGKLGYLDVLESREALFEIRAEYLGALAAFHETRVELERLTAGASTATGTEK